MIKSIIGIVNKYNNLKKSKEEYQYAIELLELAEGDLTNPIRLLNGRLNFIKQEIKKLENLNVRIV